MRIRVAATIFTGASLLTACGGASPNRSVGIGSSEPISTPTPIAASPTASGGPSETSLEGLAFVRSVKGVSQLFRVGPTGDATQLTHLQNDMGGLFGPMWSPDGTRIAFSTGAPSPIFTWVVDGDGGNQQQLSSQGILIGWSPDSQSVLIQAFTDVVLPGWEPEHWLVDVQTGEAEPVVLPMVRRWLPDGRYLVINWDASGAPSASVLDPDTGETSFTIEADEVAWSPDGTRLAYQRHTPCPPPPCVALGLADGDGANAAIVAEGASPQWSPDGSMVAYLEVVGIGPNSRLAVMTNDGVSVAVPDVLAQGFAWAPDGTVLVVATGDVMVAERALALVRLADGQNTYLGEGHSPVWPASD